MEQHIDKETLTQLTKSVRQRFQEHPWLVKIVATSKASRSRTNGRSDPRRSCPHHLRPPQWARFVSVEKRTVLLRSSTYKLQGWVPSTVCLTCRTSTAVAFASLVCVFVSTRREPRKRRLETETESVVFRSAQMPQGAPGAGSLRSCLSVACISQRDGRIWPCTQTAPSTSHMSRSPFAFHAEPIRRTLRPRHVTFPISGMPGVNTPPFAFSWCAPSFPQRAAPFHVLRVNRAARHAADACECECSRARSVHDATGAQEPGRHRASSGASTTTSHGCLAL